MWVGHSPFRKVVDIQPGSPMNHDRWMWFIHLLRVVCVSSRTYCIAFHFREIDILIYVSYSEYHNARMCVWINKSQHQIKASQRSRNPLMREQNAIAIIVRFVNISPSFKRNGDRSDRDIYWRKRNYREWLRDTFCEVQRSNFIQRRSVNREKLSCQTKQRYKSIITSYAF